MSEPPRIWRLVDLLIIPVTMGTVITLKYILMIYKIYTPLIFLTLLFMCLLAFYRLILVTSINTEPAMKQFASGDKSNVKARSDIKAGSNIKVDLVSQRTMTSTASVFTTLVAVGGYAFIGILSGLKWFNWLNNLGYLPLFLISLPPTIVNWLARLILVGMTTEDQMDK